MTAITFDTHQAPEMPFRVAEEPVPYNTRTRMETDNPYALMADLVGIGAGGPPDIAQNHKKIYREALSKERSYPSLRGCSRRRPRHHS